MFSIDKLWFFMCGKSFEKPYIGTLKWNDFLVKFMIFLYLLISLISLLYFVCDLNSTYWKFSKSHYCLSPTNNSILQNHRLRCRGRIWLYLHITIRGLKSWRLLPLSPFVIDINLYLWGKTILLCACVATHMAHVHSQLARQASMHAYPYGQSLNTLASARALLINAQATLA